LSGPVVISQGARKAPPPSKETFYRLPQSWTS